MIVFMKNLAFKINNSIINSVKTEADRFFIEDVCNIRWILFFV